MLKLEQVPTIGPIGPRRDGVDKPFWDGLADGELRMQCCSKCGHWWWSPVWRCGECGSWDLEWRAIPARGKVFSWVKTYQKFSPSMSELTPFVTLLVELPDAGNRRLFGILVGPEDGLELGASVKGVIQPASKLTHGCAVLRWEMAK